MFGFVLAGNPNQCEQGWQWVGLTRKSWESRSDAIFQNHEKPCIDLHDSYRVSHGDNNTEGQQ